MQITDFARTSPSKVFQRAANYTKNLRRHHQLPKSLSKSMAVRAEAENQKQHVDFAIRRSSYQLELYRRKQKEDTMRRSSYGQKLMASAEKVGKNEKEIEAKHAKEAENYEKHLHATYKKYEQEEKRHRALQKESSYKLRKELQEFYAKEAERKSSAEKKQASVGTCYQSAIQKINNIHKLNEERSLRAQQEINRDLSKNNHFKEVLAGKRRSVSSINSSKIKAYDNNLSIFEKRQHEFVQRYGRNEDGSLKAWRHKQESGEKTKKRLNEFFKKRVQHWCQQKKRADAAKEQIPKKCTGILERTNNSFYHQSVSPFRSSAGQWQKTVMLNKSAIHDEDQRKKEQIMSNHLDLRLKNTSSYKVSERMESMRLQAKKLASEYL